MITPYNILGHELIGLATKISGKTHSGYDCQGRIVGESKNVLEVEISSGKIKKLPKNSILLELKLPQEAKVKVDGNLLIARPEDRIKKKYRIKFV